MSGEAFAALGEAFGGAIEMTPMVLPDLEPLAPELLEPLQTGARDLTEAGTSASTNLAGAPIRTAVPEVAAAVRAAAPEAGSIAEGTVTSSSSRAAAGATINYNGAVPKTWMESLTGGDAIGGLTKAGTVGFGVWKANETINKLTGGVASLFSGAANEAERLEAAAAHLASAGKQKTEDSLHASEAEFDKALQAMKNKAGLSFGPAKTALESTLAVVTVMGVVYVSFEVYMFLKRRSK
jgi:hypothetical protein